MDNLTINSVFRVYNDEEKAYILYDVLATIYEFEQHMVWRLVDTTATTVLKNTCH